MISHYCRRLYEMHLIKILSDINQKRVVARIFVDRQQHLDINALKKTKRYNRRLLDPVSHHSQHLQQIEDDKWTAFRKGKFVFRELNFDENMKLNLMSA